MNPYLSDYNICKVVGNIFENPDLIAWLNPRFPQTFDWED
jgi:hypothetical protein